MVHDFQNADGAPLWHLNLHGQCMMRILISALPVNATDLRLAKAAAATAAADNKQKNQAALHTKKKREKTKQQCMAKKKEVN